MRSEYQELKRALRIAKVEAANVPGIGRIGFADYGNGDQPPVFKGGPLDKWRKHRLNVANGRVRRAVKALAAYRKRHGIIVPTFPGPVAKADWRDARIRKQYTPGKYAGILESAGWKGMKQTPAGPEWY
jgi:hypothetical protein